jgi:hypothetical protein
MATPPVFTSGAILTAAQMNAVGMWLVGETTFAASAKPYINGCFTSDYDNYLVNFSVYGSAAANLFFQMRSATSTEETGAVYDRYGFQWTGAGGAQDLTSANQTSALLGDVSTTSSSRTTGNVAFYAPNLSNVNTVAIVTVYDGNNGYSRLPMHRIETNTQYTGLQLAPSSGTLTGTMKVYGYHN